MPQAWICEQASGVETLKWQDLTLPDLRDGELRVAIKAASLNYPDLLIVQGKYQFKPALPFVPGTEFSGIVEAVGAGVRGFKVGDRVAAFAGTGGFATHVNVAATLAMPLPEGFELEDAAAFICTYGTSHHALIDRAGLKSGETLLVLGAAGGVGTAAIQIAKAVGARVIAAVSSDDKARRCLELGADACINYTSSPLRESIKQLTGGLGPDVIYDPVGGALSEQAFRSIAWRGRHLVVGFAQGEIPALPLNLALLKGAALVGVFWGEFAKREPANNASMMKQLAQWYAEGKIKPALDSVLPLQQLPEAFARMSSRQVIGKIVLTSAA